MIDCKYARRAACKSKLFLEKGVTMKYLIRTCSCMALCLSFCMSAGQLYGQTTYTVTGSVDNFGLVVSPEVSDGETFVAEFEIDLSVVDSDSSSERGEYAGAILSSSIVFSGGYTSQVDFAGGEIVVLPDSDGGGIFLSEADGASSIVVFDLGNPFDSDALPTDPAMSFDGGPESLFVLLEPTGFISSFTDVSIGPATSSLAFSISVSPDVEPVLLGDVDLSGAVDFGDISPFISVLLGGLFQDEADVDGSGEVDFSDIKPFVDLVLGSIVN